MVVIYDYIDAGEPLPAKIAACPGCPWLL